MAADGAGIRECHQLEIRVSPERKAPFQRTIEITGTLQFSRKVAPQTVPVADIKQAAAQRVTGHQAAVQTQIQGVLPVERIITAQGESLAVTVNGGADAAVRHGNGVIKAQPASQVI